MKVKIIPRAISWKTRRIKVVDEWGNVSQKVDLANIILNVVNEVEIETNLRNEVTITKVYS